MKNINKVAEITVIFWIIKMCATTLGETAGDLMSMTLNVGYGMSTMILIGILSIVLFFQIKSLKYNIFLFWTAILLTSIVGTTISDFIDRTLGLGYTAGSSILISILLTILIIWKYTEKSLSVSSISSKRSEFFYWLAILVSNTLGTALGDYLADTSGLGFTGGALLVGTLLAITTFIYYMTKKYEVLLFWIAFILTRPFGATFGDLMTKTTEQGGLNFGTIGSSSVLFLVLITLILYQWKRDQKSISQHHQF